MIIQKALHIARDKKKQNFVIYGLGHAFNLISPLLVVPYIVRVCGEEGLGKTGLGFALALFLILVVDYAFDIKGTKEVAENRDNSAKLKAILNTTIATKILLFTITAAIVLALVNLAPFFREEKTLFLFSMAIVLAQVFNPVWFLQGVEKFVPASMVNIGSKITYVVLVYAFINNNQHYVLVNLFLGLSSFVFNIAGLIYILKKFKIPLIKLDFAAIKAILKADFSFCISQLFLSVRQLSPLVLTGYFLGYYAAGQYKIIEQVVTLFRTFIQVYLRFFYPSVCYKISQSVKEGISFWKKYTTYNTALITVLLITAFIFSDYILMFFNASEETIDNIGGIFRVALFIPLLMSVSLPLEQLMFINNKNRIYIRIAIAVTVINVAFVALLINTHGIPGIIVSLIVAELLFIALYTINARTQLNLK